jgi:hypothetical protein
MVRQDARGDLKRYFKEIKSLFPVYGEREKLFLADFISDVNDYAALYPESDYTQLIAAFGEPRIIVSQYIANADSAYLTKQIKIAAIVRRCVLIIVALAFITAVMFTVLKYQSYVEMREQYIAREVTVIAEE